MAGDDYNEKLQTVDQNFPERGKVLKQVDLGNFSGYKPNIGQLIFNLFIKLQLEMINWQHFRKLICENLYINILLQEEKKY